MDLAVGAFGDSDGGVWRAGAVYILFMNPDGTVRRGQKISSTQGGLVGPLYSADFFGTSVGAVGDLDGDWVMDLAVGANEDDDGGSDRGAVYILFMKPDGTVKREQKISSSQGGLVGPLDNYDFFGYSVAAVGDLDGDGVVDLAVGAAGDDDGAVWDGGGAVYILFMYTQGSVRREQKISATQGGLGARLHVGDYFGSSVGRMGDLDRDGVMDLAVGALLDNDGGAAQGAVYILLLNADGSVKGEQKISSTQGPALGLDSFAYFGSSVTVLGDLDGNGVMSLAVGAPGGGANLVFVLEVPFGFVPMCAPHRETCVNTADSMYSYECTKKEF